MTYRLATASSVADSLQVRSRACLSASHRSALRRSDSLRRLISSICIVIAALIKQFHALGFDSCTRRSDDAASSAKSIALSGRKQYDM